MSCTTNPILTCCRGENRFGCAFSNHITNAIMEHFISLLLDSSRIELKILREQNCLCNTSIWWAMSYMKFTRMRECRMWSQRPTCLSNVCSCEAVYIWQIRSPQSLFLYITCLYSFCFVLFFLFCLLLYSYSPSVVHCIFFFLQVI